MEKTSVFGGGKGAGGGGLGVGIFSIQLNWKNNSVA